jgi:hypothetical protein
MLRLFGRAALLLLPLLAFAKDPWLLAFPEISFDSGHIFFSGPKWTAVYTPGAPAPTTLPRDTLVAHKALPPAAIPPRSGSCNSLFFRAENNTLISTSADGIDSVRTLPPPTVDAIACLGKDAARNTNPANLVEIIGPITSRYNRIWFGLLLRDTVTHATVSGVGWFDPYWNRFSRVYSPVLSGMQPEWIYSRDSTTYVLFARKAHGATQRTTLTGLSLRDFTLSEIALAKEGIPGSLVLNASQLGDTLILCTDEAIAYWKPHRNPLIWQTKAWASRVTRFLYLKTFPDGDPGAADSVAFMPLKSNTPTEVKAKVGSWLQVVAPIGIEGYVDAREWEKHAVLWSQKSWACRDSLCFVRLEVPMHEHLTEVDFTNTPLTYIDRDANGVKVGFRAAWAREDELIPVLMAP